MDCDGQVVLGNCKKVAQKMSKSCSKTQKMLSEFSIVRTEIGWLSALFAYFSLQDCMHIRQLMNHTVFPTFILQVVWAQYHTLS